MILFMYLIMIVTTQFTKKYNPKKSKRGHLLTVTTYDTAIQKT